MLTAKETSKLRLFADRNKQKCQMPKGLRRSGAALSRCRIGGEAAQETGPDSRSASKVAALHAWVFNTSTVEHER